jgi:hypothetical protein
MNITLSGYRTYAAVVVGLGLGVAQALGYNIPPEAVTLIGFLGLGAHRLALSNASAKTTEDILTLVKAVTDTVEPVRPAATPIKPVVK